MTAATSRLKYVFPNAVTAIGMLFGLYSITLTIVGDYEQAAWMILVCVLIDKLDGSVARLLNASSRFGVELDSFSDFLTFGVAPGLLFLSLMTDDPRYMSTWQGGSVWFVRFSCGFFIVMAALRLAKFNVLTEEIGSKIFLGIPTTLTGGTLAAYVLTVWKYDLPDVMLQYAPVILIVFGLWMVSNVPIPKIRVTKSLAFNIFTAVNAVGAYVCTPLQVLPEYLFAVAFGYCTIGTWYALVFMKPEKAPPEDTRARLLELLKELSYENREITLASGQKSNFYVDCRNTSLHPEGIVLCGRELLDLLQEDGPEFDAVAGPSIGADPLISGILHASQERKSPIPGMFVRKEPKGHGTGRLLEGTRNVRDGARIAIVEDVITTGGSAIRTIRAVREAGYEVVRLVALVDRQEGGVPKLEAEKVEVTTLFKKSDFIGSGT